MPFFLTLLLSLLIAMQMTELPILILWVYWVFDLVFG